MDKVEIEKLEYCLENGSYKNVDYEKVFDDFFNKDNLVLKNVLVECLKTISNKLNIFSWSLKFENFAMYKDSHYAMYISINSSCFGNNICDEKVAFVKNKDKNSKILKFPVFDMANIDVFETFFIDFIKDSNLFFVVPKKYYKDAKENKSYYSVFDKEHDEFQSKINYLDNLFGNTRINDLYYYSHTYILGDKFYVSANLSEPLLDIFFDEKTILKNILFDKRFSSKISNEELNMIFESDDIEEIVQNIRLLSY